MKTIERALDILEILLDHNGEVFMPDLARLSGLNNNSLYRITSTLRKRGYLRQRKKRGKYTLGPKFLEYCHHAKSKVNVEDIAYLYQEELCKKTGESVNYTVFDNSRNMAIDKQIVHTPHPLKVATEEGTELPLYCSSAGKILLASMGNQELNKYLENNELKTHTANTITSVPKLKKQLKAIRDRNIAFDDEEFLLGVRAVASGVLDKNGNTIATFGIFGPSARITIEKMNELAPLVRRYAQMLSAGIGYKSE